MMPWHSTLSSAPNPMAHCFRTAPPGIARTRTLPANLAFILSGKTLDRSFYSRLFQKYLTRSSFSTGQPRKLIFREYYFTKSVWESEHIDYGEILWL
jgi:hypothetical protein